MNRPLPAPSAHGALSPEVGVIDQRLARLRQVAWLLDNSFRIPGTRIRFGIDSIIGLVPGLGDLIAGAMSLYIIGEAARLGLPRSILTRMGWNVAVDTLVGEVPILGDVFDVAWKANVRNLVLIENHLRQPAETTRASLGFILLLGLAVILLIAGSIALAVVLFKLFDHVLRGGLIG